MQYQSIIRLFNHLGIAYDVSSELYISRIKKQVNAEFAIETDGIISIDGINYTKNDVLKSIEEGHWSDTVRFHKMIWDNKGFLELLEHDKLDLDQAHQWLPLSKDKGFVAFVSPYFAVRFNSVMKSLLQVGNLSAASQWLAFAVFVEPEDEEVAYKSLRMYLDDAIKLFKNVNEVSYKQRAEELRPWATLQWHSFINQLPDSLLHYTDDIASEVINFTVRIQKVEPRFCYVLSGELVKLNKVNYSLRQLILENHEIYASNTKSAPVKGSKAPPAYVWVLIVIAVLRLIASNSGCSKNDKIEVETVRFTESVSAKKLVRKLYSQEFNNRSDTGFRKTEAFYYFTKDPIFFVYQTDGAKFVADYPIVFDNRTRYRIRLDMLSASNLYNVVSDSSSNLMFTPEIGGNFDFVMSFFDPNLGSVDHGKEFEYDDMQYLHSINKNLSPSKSIQFKNDLMFTLNIITKEGAKNESKRNTIVIEEEKGRIKLRFLNFNPKILNQKTFVQENK